MNQTDLVDAFKSIQYVADNFPDENVRMAVALIYFQFYHMDAATLVRPLSPEERAELRQLENTITSVMPEEGKRITYLRRGQAYHLSD